jgi:hypothetical protein
MQRLIYLATAALALVTAMLSAAQALNTRSYVSAVSGSDSNGCTATVPCRTFARAITKTEAGGEIDALEAGRLRPGDHHRAINILGVAGSGVIASSGGDGVAINAGSIDVIKLRGLVILPRLRTRLLLVRAGAALSTGPHPTLILRGLAFSAFGRIRVITPSCRSAVMRSWSILFES